MGPALRCLSKSWKRIAGKNVRTRADPYWRDWANLTAGPAGLIAERVLATDVADYVRFRAVCSSWRRCTASPRAHFVLNRRFHPRRWIMLPRTFAALRKRREFLNVSTGERILVDLPELRHHHVVGPTSGGHIVICDKRTYAVRLLNPLTRQLTSLPKLRICGTYATKLHVYGAGLADASTVALHLGPYWLAIARPGDKHWTRLYVGYSSGHAVIASLSFASRFYCVTENAIMVVDTTADTPQLVLAAELGDDCDLKQYDRTVRLLDNDGELILVHRIPRGEGLKVHRVDLEARITLPTQEPRGRTLFVGDKHVGGQSSRPDWWISCRN